MIRELMKVFIDATAVELWGDDNGKGVRSAVGMGSLPGNVAVEIEGIFEIA